MTLAPDDVHALLEDGPKALEELAGWLELPPSVLAAVLDQLQIQTCERCTKRFLKAPHSAGRFCSRRCYAPVPRPPYQKKVIFRQPHIEPADALVGEDDLLYVQDSPADIDEDLDEFEAPPPARPGRKSRSVPLRQSPAPTSAEPSWWCGKDRDAFAAAAREESDRLTKSKFGRSLPARTLP